MATLPCGYHLVLAAAFMTQTSGGSTFTFHEGPISWEAALAACEAQGGSLASIHSESENAAAHAVTSGRRAYIGLNDRANEDSFVWADGTPVDFTRWGGSEPNSYAGSNEDCAGFHPYYFDGGWNDFTCYGYDANDGEPIGYVCSTPLPPPPPPSPPSPPSPPFSPDTSVAIIVGASVGGVIALIIIILVIWRCTRASGK